MAVELQYSGVPDETMIASGDLTTKVGYGVKISGATANGMTGVLATAGKVWAVIVNKAANGETLRVRRNGKAVVKLAGPVIPGDYLTTDATGAFVKLATTGDLMGTADETGNTGDLITATVQPTTPV
jgi:hypothetical protein